MTSSLRHRPVACRVRDGRRRVEDDGPVASRQPHGHQSLLLEKVPAKAAAVAFEGPAELVLQSVADWLGNGLDPVEKLAGDAR